MTSLADALERLQRQVLAGLPAQGGAVSSAVDRAHFFDPDVVMGTNGIAEVVSVQPVGELLVDQLAAFLGPARRLPRPSGGGPRTVLFTETLPLAGDTAATVLAEIDDNDVVSRVVVRADHY